jgi:DNA-binding NarL/FixJ family response regulator
VPQVTVRRNISMAVKKLQVKDREEAIRMVVG